MAKFNEEMKKDGDLWTWSFYTKIQRILINSASIRLSENLSIKKLGRIATIGSWIKL